MPIDLRILAFELEQPSRPGFESEKFIDTLGRTLLTIEKSDADDVDRKLDSTQELSPKVRSALETVVSAAEITRLQIENEWGEEVVVAKWSSGDFVHEIKITMDGHPLFLEISAPQPLPTAVQKELTESNGAEIEAMILYTYGLVDPDSSQIVGLSLANGIPIDIGLSQFEPDTNQMRGN